MHRTIARLLAPLGTTGLLALAGATGASAQTADWYTVTNDPQVINHVDTVSFVYHCPNGARVAQNLVDDGPIVNNTSSANVTMAQFLNYDGSLQISFTNWNVDGDQTYSFTVGCQGQAPAPVPVPALAPAPAPQAPQQPQAPAPQVGLSQIDFQAAYDALLKSLPMAPRIQHW